MILDFRFPSFEHSAGYLQQAGVKKKSTTSSPDTRNCVHSVKILCGYRYFQNLRTQTQYSSVECPLLMKKIENISAVSGVFDASGVSSTSGASATFSASCTSGASATSGTRVKPMQCSTSAHNRSHRETHNNKQAKLIGALFVACSAISWGLSGTLAQYLTQWQNVQVEWICCVRMLGAALLLLPVALGRTETRQEIACMFRNKTDLRGIAVYAICGAFLCQIGYLFTIAYTNSGTATMFEQLGMVIVVAVTCISVKRMPTSKELVALALALAGTFCFCTQGHMGLLAMPLEGLLWGLVASVGMATYILLPVRLLKKYSGITVTFLAMVIAGISITVVFQPWNIMPALNASVVIGSFGTIILGNIIPYLLFMAGVKRIGPVVGGLLDAIEPITAIGASALCLGTIVTGWDVLGCALIVGMIVFITLPEKAENAEKAPHKHAHKSPRLRRVSD